MARTSFTGVLPFVVLLEISRKDCFMTTCTLQLCHRDLKPGNILVQWRDQDGSHDEDIDWNTVSIQSLRFKVTGFGHSRFIRPEDTLTAVGTLFYWGPEVLSGRYDHSADVYSIGVICFELTFGRLPGPQDRK